MKRPKLIIMALVACFFLAGMQGTALTQQKTSPHEPQRVTIKGTIHKKSDGKGYYLRGVTEVYGIMNENPDVLEPLAQSGKTVTVAAKPHGDMLTVEEIDGKPYAGKQKPVPK